MDPRTDPYPQGADARMSPGQFFDRPSPQEPRANGAERSARALGWLSVGLGVAQLIAPDELSRFTIGRDGRSRERAMRALGARELVCGIGLLARRRPTGWLWARVAGDLMDLALLRSAQTARNRHRVRRAVGAVAGVALIDTIASIRLSRAGGARLRRLFGSVTINRSPEDIYRYWRDFQNLPRFMAQLESVQAHDDRHSRWVARGLAGRPVAWEAELVDDRANELIGWRTLPGGDVQHSGAVRFVRAPGGRGTEVHVAMEYRPSARLFGLRLAKIIGRDPQQQLGRDLRRCKQLLETGEILQGGGR